MSIDLEKERLTLQEVAERLNTTVLTIQRYCKQGLRGVKLYSFKIGGRRYVYPESIQEFIDATADETLPNPEKQVRSKAEMKRSIAKAQAYIDHFCNKNKKVLPK
jgi:predicted transcriptional regulator